VARLIVATTYIFSGLQKLNLNFIDNDFPWIVEPISNVFPAARGPLYALGIGAPVGSVTAMLLEELGEPVMSSTLLLPGEELPRTDAKEIYERLEHSVDLVLDGGNCGLIPTSVIDLSGDRAILVRVGRGDVSPFADSATV